MQTGRYLLGKVFISHSTSDKPFVRRLARRLEGAGFKTWLDERELMPGDRLSETIAAALTEAKVILVVVSHTSVKSKWLRYELNLATERMIKGSCRVIPIVVDNCTLPHALDGLLYADFRGDFSKGLKQVLTALRHEAGRAAKASGFWAQASDLIESTFSGRGFTLYGGDYDSRSDDFVSVPVLDSYGHEKQVIYDVVANYGRQRRPLAEDWWNEYTQHRKDSDGDLFLVFTDRPVAIPHIAAFPPGERIKLCKFVRNDLERGRAQVVFADVAGVRSVRGRTAILRSARRQLIRLAQMTAEPAAD